MGVVIRSASLFLVLAAGCGDDGGTAAVAPVTRMRVVMLDPEQSSFADIVAVTESVEVVLYTAAGFVSDGGDFVVVDLDGDSLGEAVARLAMPSGGGLPRVLLDGEEDDTRRVEVLARGLDGSGEVTAYGGGAGTFEPGAEVVVEIPFELGEARRPARIASEPADGNCNAGELHVALSTTATGDSTPTLRSHETDPPTDRIWGTSDEACDGGGCWTVATIVLDTASGCACQRNGTWSISFPDGAETRPFVLGGKIDGEWCQPGSGTFTQECDACRDAGVHPSQCSEGHVEDDSGRCVEDCAVHDACPDPTQRCDPPTGICVPRV